MTVPPKTAAQLAQLCRAARRAPRDRPDLIAMFVFGAISRAPIEPEALLELLDRNGIDERLWREAAERFDVPSWVRTRTGTAPSRFLSRLLRRGGTTP